MKNRPLGERARKSKHLTTKGTLLDKKLTKSITVDKFCFLLFSKKNSVTWIFDSRLSEQNRTRSYAGILQIIVFSLFQQNSGKTKMDFKVLSHQVIGHNGKLLKISRQKSQEGQ